MTVVPQFLLKRLYMAGSLRQLDEGIAFNLKNVLGPGMLTGLASLKLGDVECPVEQVLIIHEGKTQPATEVTASSPLHVLMNQEVTCLVSGLKLPVGEYKVEIEVKSREAGNVTLLIDDIIA